MVDLAATRFGLYRFADKVRRRVKQLAGRPDNSPWVMEPPSRRTGPVDFLFALDYLSPNARLTRAFHEAFGAFGLSVQLVNKVNVERVLDEVERGWQRPTVYLDLSSRPGDVFERLLYACAERGCHTMRRPEHTRWVLKAQAHAALERAGLPVPPTVILRAGEPDRDLAPEERALVGDRVVIKPSFGEASKGCVVDVEPTRANIAAARDYDRSMDWLVQRLVRWGAFDGDGDGDDDDGRPPRQAYFRAYNVCGHRTLLWWCKDKGVDGYDLMTWSDVRRHDLMPALDLVDKLAEVTGMDFFSTEVAVVADSGPPEQRFRLIDYVNDQCDMDCDAHPEYSPSPAFMQWVAGRLAEFTWRRKHDLPEPRFRGVFFPDTGEK